MLCIVLLWVVMGIAISSFFYNGSPISPDDKPTPEQMRMGLIVQIVHGLTSLAMTLAYLRFSVQATWQDLGFDLRKLGPDVLLGTAAFLALAPVVFGWLNILIEYLPYKHPVLDAVKNNLNNSTYWLALASAVFIAPLSEEFLFRGFLQGWFEKQPALGELGAPVAVAVADGSATASPVQVVSAAAIVSENPFAAPNSAEPRIHTYSNGDSALTNDVPRMPSRSWTPIIIASTVFALLHISQGPAAIPLFVLAMGMGYLYRQTHRITPSLVVHLLLNACAMATLWWNITHPEVAP